MRLGEWRRWELGLRSSLLSPGPVSASGQRCCSLSVKVLEMRTRQEEVRYFTFFPLDCHLCQAVEQRIREEQRMMDEKIVLELDQKVIDQQSTLEKAGVSGFYITTNPQVRAGQRACGLAALLSYVFIILFDFSSCS